MLEEGVCGTRAVRATSLRPGRHIAAGFPILGSEADRVTLRPRVRAGSHPVGTFSFAGHASHNHRHFDEFAVYELRSAANALIATSDKVSFCLLDFDPYTAESIPGAPAVGVYDCSNQGISKGWADVYSGGLDGQWIDITGVADGTYKLRSVVDPNSRLHEEPKTNNAAEITIAISGGRVTVQ